MYVACANNYKAFNQLDKKLN